jgi:hypothetical protein
MLRYKRKSLKPAEKSFCLRIRALHDPVAPRRDSGESGRAIPGLSGN